MSNKPQVAMPNRWQMAVLYPVCLLACLLAMLWLPVAILFGSRHAAAIEIASDRMANAAIGGNDRETISSRAYRGMRNGSRKWCVLCRLLDIVQKDHCKLSDGY